MYVFGGDIMFSFLGNIIRQQKIKLFFHFENVIAQTPIYWLSCSSALDKLLDYMFEQKKIKNGNKKMYEDLLLKDSSR